MSVNSGACRITVTLIGTSIVHLLEKVEQPIELFSCRSVDIDGRRRFSDRS